MRFGLKKTTTLLLVVAMLVLVAFTAAAEEAQLQDASIIPELGDILTPDEETELIDELLEEELIVEDELFVEEDFFENTQQIEQTVVPLAGTNFLLEEADKSLLQALRDYVFANLGSYYSYGAIFASDVIDWVGDAKNMLDDPDATQAEVNSMYNNFLEFMKNGTGSYPGTFTPIGGEVEPTTFTVTFDTQGGSAVEPQTVEEDGTAIEPTDPVKDGYEFLGWYDAATGGNAWNFETLITEDVTIFAQWEEVVVAQRIPIFPIDTVTNNQLHEYKAWVGGHYEFKNDFWGWVYGDPIPGFVGQFKDLVDSDVLSFKLEGGYAYNKNSLINYFGEMTNHALSTTPLHVTFMRMMRGGYYVPPFNDNLAESSMRTQTYLGSLMQLSTYAHRALQLLIDHAEINGFAGPELAAAKDQTGLYVNHGPSALGYVTRFYDLFEALGLSFPVTVYHTVTFDVDGVTTTLEVEDGEVATKPADPVKEGYIFLGWYNAAEGGNAWNFETPITEDVTLYAQWEVLNPIDTADLEDLIEAAKGYLETWTKPLVKNNVTIFAFELPDFAAAITAAEAVVDNPVSDANVTAAVRTLKIEIINGFSVVAILLQAEINDFNPDLYDNPSGVTPPYVGSKEYIVANKSGYMGGRGVYYSGLSDQSKVDAYSWSTAFPPDARQYTQVYNTWDGLIVKPVSTTFTVTFDVDGVTTTLEVEEGEVATKPADPVKEGYIFLGWYNAAEGGTEWNFETPITEDVTLYAQWEEKVDPNQPTIVDGWYQIAIVEHLNWFAAQVNSGNNVIKGKLIADIVTNTGYTPIGTFSPSMPFKGEFDGDGHAVELGIYSSSSYQGLFGYVNGGSVKNVTVGGSVTGGENTGGIVGFANGGTTISGCVNNATITGSYHVGGILGRTANSVTVNQCANTGAIISTGADTTSRGTGGVVGYIAGTTVINECYNSGKVDGTAYAAGGITGATGGGSKICTITNCYNVGEVNYIGTNTSRYAGGIVGLSLTGDPVVENCYNAGAIGGITGTTVGGVIASGGAMTTIINNFYLEGTAALGKAGVADETGKLQVVTEAQLKGLAGTLGDAYESGINYPVLKWQDEGVVLPTTFTVTFDVDGVTTTLEVEENGVAVQPADPVKEGYIFLGWYNAAVGGTEWDFETPITEDVVLYAQWEVEITGPFEISTWDELLAFAAKINGGETDLDAIVTADITQPAGATWTPIGTTSALAYAGEFDGGNFTITLSYSTSSNYQGLFGYTNGATIKNVKMAGSITTTGNYGVGAVVGQATNTIIENCVNYATLTGRMEVGGIAGSIRAESSISGCENHGAITGTTDVGGLVGFVNGSHIGTSLNNGAIRGHNATTGGLNGCAGGIVGQSIGATTIDNCYNTANGVVNGNVQHQGGIIGNINYNSFVTNNNADITNCYNLAKIGNGVGANNYGGIVGVVQANATGKVENCYNAGQLSGNAYTLMGGVIGSNSALVISNSYYLDSTATKGVGTGSGTATAVTATTLKGLAGTLGEAYKRGSVYPILQWQPNEAITFTVAFDVDGEEYASQEVEENGVAVKPADPVKEGYIFLGWFDAVEDGTEWDFDTVVTDDIMLYAYWEVDPTPVMDGDWYLISNVDELLWFADQVNGGNNAIKGRVVADIDASEAAWSPIGSQGVPFVGQFDGGNFTITFDHHPTNNNSTDNYQGLIGYAGAGAVVENVVVDGSISGWNYVGGVVGSAESATIKNCINKADITARGYMGGVAGSARDSLIQNCVNQIDVNIRGGNNAGGVVGAAYGNTIIEGCVNKAALTFAVGDNNIGGIVGYLGSIGTGKVTGCLNSGNITAGYNVGGIAGQLLSDWAIEECGNSGAIASITTSYSSSYGTGGIVGGVSRATVERCYNTGVISGNTISTGGIAGYLSDTTGTTNNLVRNCYNRGAINYTGTNVSSRLGGIVGHSNSSNAYISNCYSSGTMSGISNSIGGVIGFAGDYNLLTKIEKNYYLTSIAAKGIGGGGVVDTEGKVEPVSAATLKYLAPTLGEAYKEGSTYPILKWQTGETLYSEYTVVLEADSPTDLNIGDTLKVNVMVYGEGLSFLGAQVQIPYDTARLQFTGYSNIAGEAVKNAGTSGTINFNTILDGDQEIGTGFLLFTVSFKVIGSEAGSGSLNANDCMIVPSGETQDRDAKNGEALTFTVHNLAVTFTAGVGVTMNDATAYIKYGVVGLYTDSTYETAFTIPTPVADSGYMLLDPVWNDGTNSYTSAEITEMLLDGGTVFTAQAVKVWNVAFYDAEGVLIDELQTVADGGFAVAPADPVAPVGMSFAGWYIVTDADDAYVDQELLTGADIAELAVTADVSYKAHFSHNSYALAYDEEAVEVLTGEGPAGFATHGTDVTFQLLNLDSSYDYAVSYTVGGEDMGFLTAVSGVYTIEGDDIIGDVEITVTQLVKGEITFIEFDEYLGAPLNFKVALLHIAGTDGEPVDGVAYLYDGEVMFWSAKYDAYAYFVDSELDELDALARISISDDTQLLIAYDGDVNRTNAVNITDATIISNLYKGLQSYIEDIDFERVKMLCRLEADVNGDGTVDGADVRLVQLIIIGE